MGILKEQYRKEREKGKYEYKLQQEIDLDETEQKLLETFKRNQNHSLKTLIGIYKGHYLELFLAVFFFAVKHSPVWVLPIITANIVNIATNKEENAAGKIAVQVVIMVILIAQNVLSNYFHTLCYARAIRNVERDLRSSLVRKLQQLSITYHNEMQSGRLQSKIMRDVEQIETLSSQIFITILSIIMNVTVSFVVVVTKSLTVFAFFLATMPVAVCIMVTFRTRIKSYNKEFRKDMEETSVHVMEMIEMIPVTRAHALEEKEIGKMDSHLSHVAKSGLRLDMVQSYFSSISWTSFQIFQVLCLGFTGYLASKGKISVGEVVMYQTYFATIVSQVSNIITLLPTIAKGLESVDSIGDVLLCHDVEDYHNKKKLSALRGEITFENTGFQYKNGEESIFTNLNLKVQEGETVALVGESGAGKTTILNMVIGFLHATEGRVLIDGYDMEIIHLKNYRSHIAVVPQTPILFSGTIRENITYGKDDISDEKLMEVIRAANLEEVIGQLPDGVDTMVMEHGSNLSGGQRQRVSIARAFIRDPKILILDEATSALDSIAEEKIQSATQQLVKGRTTLIVAHRLSTIRNADHIAVIGHGGLLEYGTYEELMEKQGEFYKLRQLQM
ncbi:MAG: ABC transporter ATP-binding protein [Lachnospiraceae bacterium]|nr:ABC transporter ATP-binding protein [Lachnospiraceae bacterium]